MRARSLVGCSAALLVVVSATISSQEARRVAAPSAASAVTFTDVIAPILYDQCVTCHRAGEAAPFPLVTYEDAARRGALIAAVTASRYMPPWHAAEGHGDFVGERRLTTSQISAFGEWVAQGMPRGDEAKMPALPDFPADGWRLGTPDLVLEMPAAFEVPASGPDVFRNFVIPTGLTEDRWVRAIEFRPSARRVVHHALFAYVPGGSEAARDGADGRPGFGGLGAVGAVNNGGASQGLGGWAVGATPMFLPEGVAARLPKGSDFLLQMHFHPSGKAEREKASIGIYFAEKAPDTHLMSVELPALFGFGAGIDIPPGTKQYTIADSFTLPGDIRVYTALAHAHYLATDIRASATLPDGTTRPLIWIDRWDFNWQDSYVYKQPFTLPKGTRIDATLTYDNSADNPRNPLTPPRRALWGEQSVDEMGTVGFGFEVLNPADVQPFQQALAARTKATIASAGANGTLGRFLARRQRERQGLQQLTVFDRDGNVVARVGEPAPYAQPAFSPDGRRLAVVKMDPDSDAQDVWTFDIATGTGTPVTSDAWADSAPVWSPDGTQIAYVSVRENTPGLYRRAADGTGAEERLYEHTSGRAIVLTDWSADGRHLCFWSGDAMFVLPVDGDRTAVQLDAGAFSGRGGRFSPDSRFLAFNSNRSGRFEIYLRPLASLEAGTSATDATAAVQVSAAGAIGGIDWRQDGREMFFLSMPPRQTLMAVEVDPSQGAPVGSPRRLFALTTPPGAPAQLSSIASPDGQRFVFAVNLPRAAAAR